MGRCKMELEDINQEKDEESSALDTMNMLEGSENIQNLMRQKPWFDKLHTARMAFEDRYESSVMSSSSSSSKFYASIQLPNFDNFELRKDTPDTRIETMQAKEVASSLNNLQETME